MGYGERMTEPAEDETSDGASDAGDAIRDWNDAERKSRMLCRVTELAVVSR